MVDKDQTTTLPLYHTAPIPSTPTIIPSTPILAPTTPASPPPYAPPAHPHPTSHEYSQLDNGYIKPTAVVIPRSKRYNNAWKAGICIAFAMLILVVLPATIFAVVFKKRNDDFAKESQKLYHGTY